MNLRDNYPNTSGMAGLQASSGFTRQQPAQQLKISRSLVVLVENKKRCMPAHMLVKIASLKIQPAENKMQQQPLLPHPAELEFSTPDIQPASLYEPEPKSRLQNLKLPTVTFRIKMIAMLFYIFQLPHNFFSISTLIISTIVCISSFGCSSANSFFKRAVVRYNLQV